MRQICKGAALIVVLGLLVTPASAVVLVPGSRGIVKSGVYAKFLARAPLGLPFPLPAPLGPDDPTGFGGTLAMFDPLGGAGGADLYLLPAGFWIGLGVPAGTTGYKYLDIAGVGGPCKVVLIRAKVVKAFCKGLGVTIGAAAFTTSLGVNLSVGLTPESYCADFGPPTFIINVPGLFKAKTAPAPLACP